MIQLIEEKTANKAWKKAANLLLMQEHTLKGRSGDVFELLHTVISIENPRQKWVYDRVPPISIGFALAELVWIMNGEVHSGIINYWNPSLPKFAGTEEIYYGAYGKRIRSHFGFDQLERAYNAFQNNSGTRQVVLQIYDVKKDFPLSNGLPRNSDIPCNICSLLKIRDGKLEWSQVMRSNDILLGMPYNFIQFTSLQEILAGWLDVEVGSYVHYSDSLHLYCRDVDRIGIDQLQEEENVDSLSIDRIRSEELFKEIYDRMKVMIVPNITEKEMFSLAQLDSNYNAYNNIMLIIAAYAAKKHHYKVLVGELITKCSNKAYVAMWDRWERKINEK